jgi:acetyl-CoA acetyltransferase family protein
MQKYEELNLYGKGGLVSQGISAEIVAEKWKLTRRELDEFALESHKRAATATARGYFKNEIVPLTTMHGDGGVGTDEGIRADATMERLASLPPAFDQNGVVTAGNSSQITDGASVLVLASPTVVETQGLEPVASVGAWVTVGVDPRRMGIGPVPAVQRLVERTGARLEDFELVELNEAFAAQVLACDRELKLDPERLNVNGGAIALGHPIGCSGARIVTTLLHELRRRHARRGLATLCVSGGLGMAVSFEAS